MHSLISSELVCRSTILHQSRAQDTSKGMGIDAISNPEEKEAALAAKRKRGNERKKAERARKKMAIDDIRDPKLKEAAMAAAKKNKSEQNKKYQKKRKAMVG